MRLDLALVERGLARSRSHAQDLIRRGWVTVDGALASKAALPVAENTDIAARADHYVSRGAHKLLAALDATGLPVPQRCLDAGASTGGFTQVLLERGAERVYAVDVGHGQLASLIRDDPRVTVWEHTHLRDLTLDHTDGRPVGLVVADVSFISLRLILVPLLGVLEPEGRAILLVKPQFEVGRGGLDDHGVVTDPLRREQAVDGIVDAAHDLGWATSARLVSPVPGENGNVETVIVLAPDDRAGAVRAEAGVVAPDDRRFGSVRHG
ncbi:MAG: TlyA family RNA methyltransferase [Propionibacteriaceae bacterium]|nr:TlyA family RNA methyltransferase [Propionibacteriaceae bacterium]